MRSDALELGDTKMVVFLGQYSSKPRKTHTQKRTQMRRESNRLERIEAIGKALLRGEERVEEFGGKPAARKAKQASHWWRKKATN
jgi:hypothetical protein